MRRDGTDARIAMFHQSPQIATPLAGTETRHGIGRAAAQLDIRWMRQVVRRQYRLIFGATVGALLGAFLVVALSTHYFTATTQLLIDPSDLRAVDNGLTASTQMADANVLQVE